MGPPRRPFAGDRRVGPPRSACAAHYRCGRRSRDAVGNFLYIFAGDDVGGSFGFSNLTQRFRIGQFFASVATPLAFAGLVVGLSYLVEINSARLDLDIVLDDAEEIEGADPEVAG